MAWIPTYSEDELRNAVANAGRWSDVLSALDLGYHGKTIATARKWASRWGIAVDHLPVGSAGSRRRYADADLRQAVEHATSWAGVLRVLGSCPSGGNWQTVKRRCTELGIDTTHFDPHASRRGRRRTLPLREILTEHSTVARSTLKRRLFSEGLKQRNCEQCGQGERWRGRHMGLILDHINGVRDDNRLANLQIICPNCAATLDTHCGRKNRGTPRSASCAECRDTFEVRSHGQRFCSQRCATRNRGRRLRGRAQPGGRRVVRPPLDQLRAEIAATSYCAVGRKYGVSDNAIRKWLKAEGTPGRAVRGGSPPAGSP